MKFLTIARNAVRDVELLAVIEDADGNVSTANAYVLKSSHDSSDALSALQQAQADIASGKSFV
jgi:hypothetical protein